MFCQKTLLFHLLNLFMILKNYLNVIVSYSLKGVKSLKGYEFKR
jgi:hypothetical protein